MTNPTLFHVIFFLKVICICFIHLPTLWCTIRICGILRHDMFHLKKLRVLWGFKVSAQDQQNATHFALTPFHTKYFTQYVTHMGFRVVCGSRCPGTWAWPFKNRHATTLKFVKPIVDSRHRKRRATICSIQAFFDFTAPFSFQKRESNERPILLFLHFSKIRQLDIFHTQFKQNY